MNDDDRIYGSGELTPPDIIGRNFTIVDRGFDRSQVTEFLQQVASAFDVLASDSTSEAMRRELRRNAEISSRVVLAGQETADRLRQQAVEDARTILDDTKHMAQELRERSQEEVQRTHAHIEELRRAFIEELRDMYDRVGASLYRFQTTNQVQDFGQIIEEISPGTVVEQPAGEPAWGETAATVEPAVGQENSAQDWGTPKPAVDDEPLVDLRGMHESQVEWVAQYEQLPAEHPSAGVVQEAMHQAVPEPAPEPSMGGWLVDSAEPVAEAPLAPPAIPGDLDDDARTEALLTGMDAVLAAEAPAPAYVPVEPVPVETPAVTPQAFEPPTVLPQTFEPPVATPAAFEPPMTEPAAVAPPPPPPPTVDALPHPPDLTPTPQPAMVDENAVRQFVLQSMQAGAPRESIEATLRESMGIHEPAAIVDSVISEHQQTASAPPTVPVPVAAPSMPAPPPRAPAQPAPFSDAAFPSAPAPDPLAAVPVPPPPPPGV